MLFQCKNDDEQVASSFVVVDPHHVCHHVLKAILSPRHFPGSHLVFPDHGDVEGSKLDEALLDAGVDPKAGKGLLLFSQICAINPQPPGSYFFAIHVQALSGTWEDDRMTAPQSGLLVHCTKIPFSQAFLPILQIELSKQTGGINEKSRIWKTGLIISCQNKVLVKVSSLR